MVREIMKRNRTPYNTTLDNNLVKKLKFLSVEINKRQNDLLEEAIEDLLKKYESKIEPKKS
ncbi:MAG: Ribbon-helix-helix domain protein [Syntrophus sp. PtaU1.Bin005]|nr:MAG: Ribbon-helix-helix domain protein [Syntrophus sp. PtaU1.Bin005]